MDYHVFFTRYEDDRSRLYFKDKEFEKEYKWLQSKLPGKEIEFRLALEGREHLDRERDKRHANRARPICGIARRRRWTCSTGFARRFRASRFRSGSRTSTSRRMGWRFLLT